MKLIMQAQGNAHVVSRSESWLCNQCYGSVGLMSCVSTSLTHWRSGQPAYKAPVESLKPERKPLASIQNCKEPLSLKVKLMLHL